MKNLVELINESSNDVTIVFELYDKSKKLVGAALEKTSLKALKVENNNVILNLCNEYDISDGYTVVKAIQENGIKLPAILNLDCDEHDGVGHLNILIFNNDNNKDVITNVLTMKDVIKCFRK